MDAARWKQVKELFDAALALNPAERDTFLHDRCGSDAGLRQEVDSLLAAHTGAGEFLDRPATPIPAANPGNLIGQSLGPYKVTELIGEGGMGAVYLARDERLKRKVAIKTLHSSLAWDAELIARLKQEARAESSISHPNICTVYDVGEINGVPYIVMEYLEGAPLRAKLSGGPLSLEQIADIGAHVASALAAAHQKGIIHRDVKPGNIFLTKDGQVKIMDFGVAKNIGPRKGTSEVLTSPWIRIGTVTYMSPEQASGEPVDGRSDIFSLGCVLYEMAAGRPPFRGSGPQAVMNAILHEQPPRPSELNRDVPLALDRLILRALEKDPALRYQTGSDMEADFRRLLRDSSSGTIPAARSGASRRRTLTIAAGAGAAAALAAVLWFTPRASSPSKPLKITSLGALRGIRENPVIAPDGDRIAFSWTGPDPYSGDREIYVQFLGAGQPLRLTSGSGQAESPVWSPNGKEIAFLRVDGDKFAYYTISPLGGTPQPLLPAVDPPPRGAGGTALAWSPDGKYLAVADRETLDSLRVLAVVNRETGERRLLVKEAPFLSNPAWSPDGKFIAFTMGSGFLSHDIYVVAASGGDPVRLTYDGRWIAGLTWTFDGSRIVFASRKVGPFRLWSVPSVGGTVEPVPQSDTDVVAPNIGRHSNRLVYARTKLTRNLLRASRGGGQPAELIASTRESFQPAYSPDGTRIAFASDRTGAYEIWVSDAAAKSQPLQITTFGGAQTGSPKWSPDSQWIAFDSRAEGNADVYVTPASGGALRRLTHDAGEDRTPVWSADGRTLFFISNRSGRNQLWRVPAEGGDASQITDDGATYIAQDPQSKDVYYTNPRGLWKRRDSGAGPPELITTEFPLLGWMFWRGALHYSRPGAKGLREIVSLGVAGGASAILPLNASRASEYMTFTISPDGEWVLFDRIDRVENEILLIENF